MIQRPLSLEQVRGAVESLAVHGVAPADAAGGRWLVGVGVADGQDGALVATRAWAATGLPARNERDLLRRLAFRDPGYRAYLDLLLARVLQAIAAGGRIERVETLLEGELRGFGPRLALVLRELQRRVRRSLTRPLSDGERRPRGVLPEQAWDDFIDATLGARAVATFARWDADLWGEIPGGAEQKFPALVEHYGPAVTAPVWLRATAWGLERRAVGLLAEAIRAAGRGQAVFLPPALAPAWEALARLGLPIRRWEARDAGDARLACVGGIHLLAGVEPPLLLLTHDDPPDELPAEARAGRIELDADIPARAADLWPAAAGAGRIAAHPSLDLAAPAWPEVPVGLEAMGSLGVPSRAALAAREPAAVRQLAHHPLFGLLLQLAIADAFGRELADQRLTLLAIGPAERPRQVDVYYRPAATDREAPQARRLGTLDEVLVELAAGVGVDTVPTLYEGAAGGPWTAGLLLLWRAGILLFGPGEATREVLLDPACFDALHRGALMGGVVRRGRTLRDTLHALLRERWERLAETTGRKVAIHV